MTIKDYANDVGRTVEEILKLCVSLNLKYKNEDELLDDEAIITLDNNLPQEEQEDLVEENIYEEDEKAEELAAATTSYNDSETKFTKIKSKKVKDTKSNKKEFLKQKKNMYKNKEKLQSNEADIRDDVVLYKNNMTVLELAEALDIKGVELIKKLMALGIMATVNQSVDYDTAEVLVADYNKELKKEETADISNFEEFEINDREEDLKERPPIITIMGHVDHGKTTLLDTIRKANVASGEAGGITQAIGAYMVNYKDKKLTFIDTPGHAAFTSMRARGAQITDIVIIIVAADDGVMPQTVEAIDHAKAANVPILVAINKVDKPDANVERTLTGLAEHGLTPESWGGDIIVNEISAKNGTGVDELLENILLVAEMQEYKANPDRYATGTVIESKKDDKAGICATVLIQNGTLRIGDPMVIGNAYAKVRTIKNDLGKGLVSAGPASPVEITGLTEVPDAGDKFMAFESEKEAKKIATERTERAKEASSNLAGVSLEDLFDRIKEGQKEIKVVLKADVNGSAEAVKSALEKIDVEGVKVEVIRSAVGGITESDVVLAGASNAMIIGFNVRGNSKVMDTAKSYGVTIKTYDIIYKVVEDMEKAMKGLLEPEFEEKVIGSLEIRQIFKFSKVGLIAGCKVTNGKVTTGAKARLIRDDIVIYNGEVNTLQKGKDNAKEVTNGMECGITLLNCQDYKEQDIIEIYELVKVEL